MHWVWGLGPKASYRAFLRWLGVWGSTTNDDNRNDRKECERQKDEQQRFSTLDSSAQEAETFLEPLNNTIVEIHVGNG